MNSRVPLTAPDSFSRQTQSLSVSFCLSAFTRAELLCCVLSTGHLLARHGLKCLKYAAVCASATLFNLLTGSRLAVQQAAGSQQ